MFSQAAASEQKNHVKIATSKGSIIIELDSASAPKTVANFLKYAKGGFYNNTIFHRVIKNFMIQGGGLNPDMEKKPTDKPIINEADNGLLNITGTIAMARTMDPHSATAQFFINVNDNRFLDHKGKTLKGWGYCVFGKVIKGMDIVKAIENVPTGLRAGRRDVPLTLVVIKSVEIVLK
ncbi:peptidylprolyl isomerase [Thermodesulfobacteriota bacterium]